MCSSLCSPLAAQIKWNSTNHSADGNNVEKAVKYLLKPHFYILVWTSLKISSLSRKLQTLIILSLFFHLGFEQFEYSDLYRKWQNVICTSVWKSIKISQPLRIRWLTTKFTACSVVLYKHRSFMSEWELPSYWQSLSCLPGEGSTDNAPNQCFLPWQPSAAPSCCFWFPRIAELEAMGKAQWNHKAKLYQRRARLWKQKRVCVGGGCSQNDIIVRWNMGTSL